MKAAVTWLGSLLANDPEECRATIAATLRIYGGQVTKTAAALDVSRPFLWHCMRLLDMRRVPAEERDRWQRLFRIQP